MTQNIDNNNKYHMEMYLKKKREEFGNFLKEKRLNLGLSIRYLANLIDFSAAYISDIEKGNRNPPKTSKLLEISKILHLNEEETEILLDKAAQCKQNSIAPDIYEYICENRLILKILRKAKDKDLKEEDWKERFDDLNL